DPSASHGTTTVVTGNCGVGFAPVRPGEQDELIQLMEGVEDIPGTALHEGIDWNWESFPEYLDLLDAKRWSMDVGAQIAHGALRSYVMGERGIRNEAATAEDIGAMAALTAEALDAGALGFTTSRILGHQSVNGDPVPGTFATEDEVFAIGRAMQRSGAVFELVPGGSVGQGGLALGSTEAHLESELDWMNRLSRQTGLPITFLIVEFVEDPDAWKGVMEYVAQANANGARLHPQTASRPAGVLLSWQSNHLFQRRPSYLQVADLPLERRLEALRKPEVRAAILSEDNAPPLSDSINDAMHLIIAQNIEGVFPLGNPVNYEPRAEASVATDARRRGADVEAHMYDLMMAEDGHAILMMPSLNFARGNCDAIHDLMADPHSVIGLADGGAHCQLICDASSTTHLLTYWARDRQGPRLPLEYLVRKQCAETAALYGLSDRGLLAPGKRADINVIDFDNLELGLPYAVNDLPAGGLRFLQPASGYIATLVNGEVTRERDQDTGARPGRLIRGRR
ncbi:MAG: amidohydrolase family protein, partial [Gammaproteobacteria bacterium]|nr:amidohydrolase family protein [Gammaproteobacteria bacterium]